MTDVTRIDAEEARRLARQLADAAEQLRQHRGRMWPRLANGDGIRPSIKVKDDVKVTIGVASYEHPGSRAGELAASKIRGCGDAYTAVEEGLRAMSTVMSRLVEQLDGADALTHEQLNTVISGLHSVALVSDDQEPERIDWFGMEAR